ncbi:MAG: LPS export ABC transporter permease LptF [Desulfuromonadaceae bacterium]|nr:LPS export ABC transporter permease LptF [Desulfuromonas sp.]MDY0184696.1 LPS export ABC transporter permease LptF [Desulfuromonadaceae bacterium]
MSALRIQTYIAREIVFNFVLSLTLFTFIVLLSRLLKLTDLVIGSGVALSSVVALFIAMLPSFLLITMPLSFLLAVLLTFARMSAESEIVAMKACGISIYKMSGPVIMLALLVCTANAYLAMYAEPTGQKNMRNIAINVAMEKASSALKAQVFNDTFPGLMLFADKVFHATNQLQGVFICDTRIGSQKTIITSKTGKLVADKSNNKLLLHLNNGAIHRDSSTGTKASLQIINFTTYDINISMEDTSSTEGSGPIRPKLQTITQLFNSLGEPSLNAKHTMLPKFELKAEIYERFILLFSPLLFSLIAIPLGISSHRSSKGAGFTVSLIVFMIFYMLLSVSKTLVIEQGWPPALTMLAPSFTFAACGVFLFISAAKERVMHPFRPVVVYLNSTFRRR